MSLWLRFLFSTVLLLPFSSGHLVDRPSFLMLFYPKFQNTKVTGAVLPPGFRCEWMGQCWAKSCKRNANHDAKTQLAGGNNVHLITTMEKWEKETSEAKKEGKIVVVNFSASWCGPCRTIAPAFSELADKYTSVVFITIDVDELAELSAAWNVKATPMFFFLKDGRQLDKLVGANKPDLQKKVAAICGSNPNSPN
ncbi:thioredoxin H-type isoform X2 [Salvia miltiorrhiza]|uniref:thioredoxin H-type isoform X2 n=1 Tax=Salvia miltiorrhiza TaxID=226208 RepID=UPI0025AB6C56|nr:thioredoxin H-type isoform X2 [Salvia miltiorrhiza]